MNFSRYMIKKSITQIQSESQSGHLKRTLGPWNLVSLGIGCIIGAGIFVMTGQAAANHAGPAIMISFILAGLACGFAGLCYAELASVLPISGSAYTYTYATLGEGLAWIMGWLLILEYGLAASTVAVGWSGYLNSIFIGFDFLVPPELVNALGQKITITEQFREFYTGHGFTIVEKIEDGNTVLYLADKSGVFITGIFNLPAFLAVAIISLLLIRGVSESATVNNVVVFIKVTVVIAFIAIGAFYIDVSNWSPFIPDYIPPDPSVPKSEGKFGFDGVVRAAGIIFFAYIGFEAVSTAAQEAKNPQKDMPIGILGSLTICTILYILVCAVLTGIVPYTELNDPAPIAVAVNKIGLDWFSVLIKLGAITGLTSVLLVLIYGQTRIFYVISRDGLLPQIFSKVHKKFETPHINTMIVGLLVAVAAALTPIRTLGDLVSLGTLCAFSIVCFSVIYLRRTEPNLPRPFRCPGVPLVPILGILGCGFLVSQMPVHIFIYQGIWFLIGISIYVFYGQHRSKLMLDSKK